MFSDFLSTRPSVRALQALSCEAKNFFGNARAPDSDSYPIYTSTTGASSVFCYPIISEKPKSPTYLRSRKGEVKVLFNANSLCLNTFKGSIVPLISFMCAFDFTCWKTCAQSVHYLSLFEDKSLVHSTRYIYIHVIEGFIQSHG